MNNKLSKYPSINQFRHLIKNITNVVRYDGKNTTGEPIYTNLPLPILKFRATVKAHGTSAAFGYSPASDEHWCQSRERIITPIDDNAGFATFAYKNSSFLKAIAKYLLYPYESKYDIILYGEWCCGNIQKGVALSEIPEKKFLIFGAKLISHNEEEPNIWLSDQEIIDVVDVKYHDNEIYHIFTFGTWEFDIDFMNPKLIQPELQKLCEDIENECPIGKYFGISATGEGFVLKCITPPFTGADYMCKIKGEKHSNSKVKKFASVDVEKVQNIKQCAETICTVNRLEQGITYLKENNIEVDVKNLGQFIKWVVTDCMKEELDTIIENGLEPKEVGKQLSTIARQWFLQNF